MSDRELTLDVISTQIDAELSNWLTKTASTAAHPDEVHAMIAGAIAGLTRFMWSNRKDHMTPEGLADHVRRDVVGFAEQHRDHDVGGTA